ncbi:MAG: DUF721 domain-containing protein [Gammaproteobacteria bacterium]|nr:DUF721 domain-containing protein [Gammaproteobacteria bacterium]
MATNKPLPLKDLLKGRDNLFGHLVQRSQEVEDLTQVVRQLAPEPVRPHIVAASIGDEMLTIVADSSAWAAQLRYRAEDILTSLNTKQGHSLQKARVRVRAGT